ncbi:bifunctional diaminohydroxyphosphoribosylaminopyrimidine deaminase/5-amino-6-(5-phosphoribosylamino)uracil reductase RibD [Sporosarcina sp. PTS2304]|uniref:bifunctional diaminohydroxyphosphoribosylaminopyrimidine deaminase/5-amino-6-(5-phosphoribosylamino)uracil reductase RibD n=1 Tax=Sporosarcina sp. PTS2304 TaxID=2283194 RepID=UPI000E0D2A5C|nr:bifunctional diaminohydroxyphosphoribosylaminopyrimidine deaminase/5-amino-6-(5-phosphoribosylamino)uracil reductase RibD [Sporosarcina sp. PTS2304]AXI01316.1 bifunctional diaminohydroxyphosphoribosylaminopyrimidine deaminase/5-amino-6-(5-phosphoribosylamino)uracil reductase RibD [Sporosarcina sp. PTS2304]
MNEIYMEMALKLAENVSGQTSPNPPVGAVLVKEGRIIGMGAHLRAGERHAERVAIDMAGTQAMGADLYVTLEPCSHTGKTTPCADAVIRSGVKHVYVAVSDPNPLVAGQGIDRMRAAGISVTKNLGIDQADKLYEPFFHFIRTKTPHVTMKTAMTIDGKISTSTGDSKWVTSEQARLDVHLLRHTQDAILVGVQTLLNDNPLLTTRLPQGGKHPIRIILDTWLRTPVESQVVQNDEAPTWIFCGNEADRKKQQALQNDHVEVIRMPNPTLYVEDILVELGLRGIMTLLVEGGAAVNASFVKARAIQRVICYVAPKILGGSLSLTSVSGLDPIFMSEAFPLEFQHVEMIGPDIKIIAVPKERG